MNSDDILKYINEEKNISKYQIESLRKSLLKKSYAKRLLEKELDFFNFPFENIHFLSIEGVRDAMALYKSSKRSFLDKFAIEESFVSRKPSKHDLGLIQRRINFLDKKYRYILGDIVVLANVFDDEYFRDLLADQLSRQKSVDIDSARNLLRKKNKGYILKKEGSVLSKQRARCQSSAYSLARYMHTIIRDSERFLQDKSGKSKSDVSRYIDKIDSNISNIDGQLFRFYNDGLVELSSLLTDTSGRNEYFFKVSPLVDLLNESSNLPDFIISGGGSIPVIKKKLCIQRIRNISSMGKDKVLNKSFGIILPLNRVGSEKINLLHKRIIIDGFDVSELFADKFINLSVESSGSNCYFKCLPLIPLNDIGRMADSKGKLFGDIFDYINANKNNSFEIKISSDSRILVPATRSESERLARSRDWSNFIVNDIKNDYKKRFGITTNHV
jgi:hypothetical protein|tara:strand:- start:558 stop:1886 length:1329 start_codon:yes stop_codon:yes gene_type:complete